MKKIRVAVVGAGQFGKHHMRVIRESERAELAAVVDQDPARAAEAASAYGCPCFTDFRQLAGLVDAAVVAVPTVKHAEVGCPLLEAGIDLLVEKPIAADLDSARRLVDTAEAHGRILQVGHLERFNPAVAALREIVDAPLFFEIHRLSIFTPRSLDVDVVLDLMIHDLDIVLSLVKAEPEEIRAAGISILSSKVDIANVRVAFPRGVVANFTASRVSTERVRKLRLFQPHQYISVDYGKQETTVLSVTPQRSIAFQPVVVNKAEPLRLEIEAFLDAVCNRSRPVVDGEDATRALRVAIAILDKIEEHSRVVAQSVASLRKLERPQR
ncbi:MAG: Gfo/Idh/MocA family oxidoreductase [Bryobacteraceae bacterium]|nr:Gfo/Idh/MocA family oxidoreductase [Bryobacteraceae bacterium]